MFYAAAAAAAAPEKCNDRLGEFGYFRPVEVGSVGKGSIGELDEVRSEFCVLGFVGW